MAGQYDPPVELLNQTGMLLYVLRDPRNQQYPDAQRHLEAHGAEPSFLLCLAYILARTTSEQVAEDVRQLAGLLLKNYVLRNRSAFLAAGQEFQDYVKMQALVAARDGNEGVRNIAGILITTIATDIVKAGNSLGTQWPELFPALVEMLNTGQLESVEGAFGSLTKILEDTGLDIKMDGAYGQQVLNQLVTVFIPFFRFGNAKVRAAAVRAMNLLVPLKPTQLTVNMESFIQNLAMLKDDSSPWVRQGVCQALVALFRDGSDHVLAKLPEVMEFMLAKSQDPAEDVARDACEFWTIFCHEYDQDNRQSKRVPGMLLSFLPRLVPVLLGAMVYSKAERESLEAENLLDLDSVPDKAEDLRPRHFHSRAAVERDHDDGDDDSGGEEDGADDLEGGEVEQWTLRKCSASTLDTMAEYFGPDAVLPVLLPLVFERLEHGDVWEREAAILALGAVASCAEGMTEHLPRIFPYLLKQLDPYDARTGNASETNPQLGCTVVWTLSRYGSWVLRQQDDQNHLAPLVERLLHVMLARNKKVQQAACSSFATLEDDAGQRLLPYLPHILPFMAEAMDRYQTRSLIVLFDTLGTLADSVRRDLAKPEHIGVFMPKLWARWQAIGDHDRVLLYLMECLTSISQSLGVQFQPWAAEAHDRCVSLIKSTLMGLQQGRAGVDVDTDFAVCALDLLTGMAEGLGPSFESLVPRGNLLELLFACMQAPSDEVRQSAFALVGDLAKACPQHLLAALPSYMPVLVDNLNPDSLSVCNNASWAIGEITVKAGGEVMAPFVAPVMDKLVPIINNHEVNHNLLENTAITLGRLAKVCPGSVAAQAGRFIHAWCMNLQEVKHRGEKEHAFEGLCLTLQQNPTVLLEGGVDTFEAFAWAVASWYNPDRGVPDPPEGLHHMFRVILQYVRDVVKSHQDWNEFLKDLDPRLIHYLVSFYEL